MPTTHPQDFQLGSWTVQPSLHRLCDGETTCQLGHKVMAVLLHLAAEPGRVVSKDELVAEIWNGAFTSDEALTTVIYELRKALGDDARKPRFVETIRKGGYRLVAQVTPLADSPSTVEVVEAETLDDETLERGEPLASLPRRRWPLLAMALAGLVLLWGLSTRQLDGSDGAASTPDEGLVEPSGGAALLSALDSPTMAPGPFDPGVLAPPASLAVLPLNSFGDQCRQDSFAGGLTEMLIADLAATSPFEVLPSLTTRGIDGAWSLEQVAERINADLVVEGTVVRAGERIWLSVQLVEIATGRMLWGGTYERQDDEGLGLQRSLAIEIAEEVGRHALPTLTLPEGDRPLLPATTP